MDLLFLTCILRNWNPRPACGTAFSSVHNISSVYESLSVCVCPCLLLVKVFTVHIVNELARRPPKPPTGGQAVTAQLIVVSIGAAGKGRSSARASR